MLLIRNRYGLQKLLAYSTGLVDQELRRNKCPVPENVILPIAQGIPDAVSQQLSIIVSVLHMLSRHEPYHEFDTNDFDGQRRHYTVDWFARRLEHLGDRVHLAPLRETAE